MAWDPSATLATFLTLEDLDKATKRFIKSNSGNEATPVLQLAAVAKEKGYQCLCLPLTTKKWEERWARMCLLPAEGPEKDKEDAGREAEQWRLNPGFRREETTLTRIDEADGVIVMLSEWLELDAADDWVRHDAEIALKQELAFACYLNVHTAIVPAPRNRDHVASYARIINSCLEKSPYINLSIRLPIYNPSVFQPVASEPIHHIPLPSDTLSPTGRVNSLPSLMVPGSERAPADSGASVNATWEMWDVIRSMCDYNPRLTLTLDLSPALPTTLGVLSKWAAESVRHIFLPSSTFIANNKGYPVLPKPTQQFIRDSMIHRPTVILAGVADGNHASGGEKTYAQYVRHLEKTSHAVLATRMAGTVENFAQGYQDFLQAPLQPLMDNLPSTTYQTFEQDPVKYAQYEEAMYHAFLDHPSSQRLVVCVAGAGRGPLVARCFKALKRSARDASVIVVEKNPNAFVTLQHRQHTEWKDKVTLCFGDMRVIDVPEKADILVSELLGSFGDNELSPECLDGAMRFLKPTGISIPSSYTAHLAPLSSSKLYNEARSTKDVKSLETPYVVMFQAVNILSGTKNTSDNRCGPQVQECWEFEHPRRDAILDSRGLPVTNTHNARSTKLRFYIPHAGILHGLAGYFEAVLYGNIGISIHPQRKDQISKDMLSWFPLFFPFKEPLYLPSNSELQVSMWRLTDDRRVWYEWHAESFIKVPASVGGSEEEMLESPFSSYLNQSFSSLASLSPLMDLKEAGQMDNSRRYDDSEPLRYEMVKIGHTSLHNPCGRSSWIGL